MYPLLVTFNLQSSGVRGVDHFTIRQCGKAEKTRRNRLRSICGRAVPMRELCNFLVWVISICVPVLGVTFPDQDVVRKLHSRFILFGCGPQA